MTVLAKLKPECIARLSYHLPANQKLEHRVIGCGADIDSRDKRGLTPLMLACETGYVSLNMNPSVIKTLLDFGANPDAEDVNGRTALSLVRLLESPVAKKITELLEGSGARQIPGKTATCAECGAPESIRMRERSVLVTFNGVFAEFPCLYCGKTEKVSLDAIDKIRGVQVSCPSCRGISFIPSSVWCKTCGIGLSTGWQKSNKKK